MPYVKELPSADRLHELFSYDPTSGVLVWRERADAGNSWNTRFAGKVAGSLGKREVRVGINGIRFKCHRVIWKMMTGEEPPEVIDHGNQSPFNNSWNNLRAADQSLNGANSAKRINQTGFRGVYRYGNKFGASISKDGTSYFLGLFFSPEAAESARYRKGVELYGKFYSE